jgi:hypothetical protein
MSHTPPDPRPNGLIIQKPNAISDSVLQRYLDFGAKSESWNTYITNTYWDGRIIHYDYMPPGMEELNSEVLAIIRAAMQEAYDLKQEIYPDDFALVRWRDGDHQDPHADSENPAGIDPHPFPWRSYGAVIYLNDAYEGGQIHFPTRNLILKPEPKTLVFFPGTLEYVHGVKPVTAGTRFTLASFWTHDRTKCVYPWTFAPAG